MNSGLKIALILVVAVIVIPIALLSMGFFGGFIFGATQDNIQTCNGDLPQTLEAKYQGFGVDEFGVSDDGTARIVLRNNDRTEITVNSVTVNGNSFSGEPSINVGDDALWSSETSGWSNDESCTEARIVVNYDRGALVDQRIEGNITAKISVP